MKPIRIPFRIDKTDMQRVTYVMDFEDIRKLFDEGAALCNENKLPEGIQQFEQALQVSQMLGYQAGVLNGTYNLGIANFKLGYYEKAKKYYEVALNVSKKFGDKKKEMDLLNKLAVVMRSLHHYDESIDKSKAAIAIALQIDDKENIRVYMNQLHVTCYSLSKIGEHDKAIENLEHALSTAEKMKDIKIQYNLLKSISRYYKNINKFNDSLIKLKAALKLAQDWNWGFLDKEEQHSLFHILTEDYLHLKPEMAIETSDKAIAIAKELNDTLNEAIDIGNKATAYKILGDHKNALKNHEYALEIARQSQNIKSEATELVNISSIYNQIGEYEKSIEYSNRVLDIANKHNLKEIKINALSNLGGVYDNIGQYPEAKKNYEAALDIADNVGNRLLKSKCFVEIGNIYSKQHQYNNAFEKFNLALKIAQDIGNIANESRIYNLMGFAFSQMQKWEKAIDKFNAALSIAKRLGNKAQEANHLRNLSAAYFYLKKYDKVNELNEDAIKLAREVEDKKGLGGALVNTGTYYLSQYYNTSSIDLLESARNYLEQADDVFEQLWHELNDDERRLMFDDSNGSALCSMHLQEVLLIQKQYDDALLVCEKAKSKSLQFLLRENQTKNTTNQSSQISSQESNKQKIEQIDTNMMIEFAVESESTIVTYSLLRDGSVMIWVIRNKVGKHDNLIYGTQSVVKEKFKSLRYLVELSQHGLGVRSNKEDKKQKSSMSLDVIVPEGMNRSDDFKEETLQQVKAECRKARECNGGDIDNIELENALRELYNVLILPIEDELVDVKRTTIVPCKELFLLPFAALLDKDGKYLIEKHILSFAPSIGTLVELQKNNHTLENKIPSAVIVGNPYYHSWMTQLGGAKEEAKQIDKILKNTQTKTFILTYEEATKSKVIKEMQSANIIHLACHGTEDGIFLSGDTKDDGKLTMSEVQNLDLRKATMVVLSACNTFKGELRTDGVVGITRAFLAAGSSTVIASLWPVGDNSTMEMMTRMYQYLFNETEDDSSMDVSHALQQTMIAMINERERSISDWAPFLVYGLNIRLK